MPPVENQTQDVAPSGTQDPVPNVDPNSSKARGAAGGGTTVGSTNGPASDKVVSSR